MWWLVGMVAWAGEPVRVALPEGTDAGDWSVAARRSGVTLTAEAPQVILEDLGAEWRVRILAGGRAVVLPEPTTAEAREDALLLVVSLVVPMDAELPRVQPALVVPPLGTPPVGPAPVPKEPPAAAVEPAPTPEAPTVELAGVAPAEVPAPVPPPVVVAAVEAAPPAAVVADPADPPDPPDRWTLRAGGGAALRDAYEAVPELGIGVARTLAPGVSVGLGGVLRGGADLGWSGDERFSTRSAALFAEGCSAGRLGVCGAVQMGMAWARFFDGGFVVRDVVVPATGVQAGPYLAVDRLWVQPTVAFTRDLRGIRATRGSEASDVSPVVLSLTVQARVLVP